MTDVDAVVIGAGPNGLVAANVLADAGWRVLVLEANAEPGGAVRSAEVLAPDFVSDWASSFHPLAAASPALRALRLEDHGLRWSRAPLALAHPLPDGCVVVDTDDLDATAASLDAFAPGDGDAWRRLYARWQQLGETFLSELLGPLPGLGVLRLASAARGRLPWFTRYALRSLRSAARDFDGPGGGMLLAGNVAHTDLDPADRTGALFGWLLASLAQQVGFPVPQGGAGRLTDALVARLQSLGGEVECNQRVVRVVVRDGRAAGVALADGSAVAASSVLADTSAPALYTELLEDVPARVGRAMRRFRWDHATVKVDWALDRAVPWDAEPARRAGTVHVVDSMHDLDTYCAALRAGLIPARPSLVIGQTTVADATRSPHGTESLWAYTHVPQVVRGDAADELSGTWDDTDAQRMADRIELEIERRAPGFRSTIRARRITTPPMFSSGDANLVGGAVNGGTARLRQQLFLRPFASLTGGARTPVRGLYLASAGAHPGGGVHGACGANAARLALRAVRR